mgnify:CR=1 FL=1
MSEELQQKLRSQLWTVANTLRGNMSASDFMYFTLGFIFYKYLSEKIELYANEELKEDGMTFKEAWESDDEELKVDLKEACVQDLGYFVEPEYLYSTIISMIDRRENILPALERSLKKIEDSTIGQESEDDFGGLFSDIDLASPKLGKTADDKNKLISDVLVALNGIDFGLKDAQEIDILGDAYEYMIGQFAAGAGKKAGEFFTPAEVSTLLAKLTKSKPGARICDPTCGSGSLLIKAGKEVGSNNFSLYGQEVNGSTWALAMMNMFLHGFDNAVIRWGDTLRNPKLKENDKLMTFDTVVANPPFSLDKWGAEEAAHDTFNRFWRGIPPKSKGDWAFITHMIEVAQEGSGKVGVVIPHGVLFRGAAEGKIRQQVINENLLEAVIGLPANLFYGTGIPAAIAIFNKGKKTDNVLFIDASREFENGKNQNKLRPEDINHIVTVYQQFTSGELEPGVAEEKYAFVATPADIQENDYNLNIPRYVDTFEEEAEVDIPAVQKEIDALETELAEVQAKMRDYLKELGY